MRASKPAVLSIFYGYPAELIAEWCGVSRETARRWKNGAKVPRPALRLFTLHRDARVLDGSWVSWRVTRQGITDPAGNTTTQRQLEAYALVMQWAASMAQRDPDAQREFFELLNRA